MSLRTVTLGIRSRLDRVLSQIENHEAVASSAIAEQRAALGRAAAHMERLRRSGERLRAELSRTGHEGERWRQRARECADDTRALECLRRARQCASHAELLQQRLRGLEELVARLGRDMAALEQRHTELCERHRALRARESRAQAAELLAESACPDLEDVFERWETRVTEQEYLVTPAADEWRDLEHQFQDEEERVELVLELRKLRGES